MKELVDLIAQLVKKGLKVEITLKNFPENQKFIRNLTEKLKEII